MLFPEAQPPQQAQQAQQAQPQQGLPMPTLGQLFPGASTGGDAFLGAKPFAEAGMAYAMHAASSGMQRMWGPLQSLRGYFTVSNSYVASKLRVVLLPYLHRGGWRRRILQSPAGDVQLPPRDDINAPDLYLPSMAFVTYVLLCALVLGLHGSFRPDVLGLAASRGLALVALEAAVVKLGFYLVSSASPPIVDVVAICGYVFIGVVLDMLAAMPLGRIGFYFAFAFTAFGMAMFALKTFRLVLLSEPLLQQDPGLIIPPPPVDNNARRYFLVIVAAMQFVVAFFLAVI